MTRTAISPRFATSTREKGGEESTTMGHNVYTIRASGDKYLGPRRT